MKIALIYDRVNKWGGAERVLLALHKIWPQAPLYTSVYDPGLAEWAKVFEVHTSFIQNLPIPKNAHEYYPFIMGIAFESFKFDDFDVVISVTSEFAKAVVTKPNTLHICLCLNPTGYLWSANQSYFFDKNFLFKLFALPIINYLRFYDLIVSHRPDDYVAISNVVASRIKKYYLQTSQVIYPPVNLFDGKQMPQTDIPVKNFYLIVSRLVPNKRLDLAIKAFNQLGDKLIVIGVGKQMNNLKSKAKKNIEFIGNLTDEQLAGYYASCKAMVVPGEEDFGIAMVEAQGFGKPVIAYGNGGALEIIEENKTGWFFKEQTASSLAKVIKATRNLEINPLECITNAKRFSKMRFEKEFKKFVENRYEQWHR